MLRDVLLRETPTVLRHGLHAMPALLGVHFGIGAPTAPRGRRRDAPE